LYCGEEYTRTQYPEHLEKNHKDEYFRLIEKIKSDIESDFSIKDTAANNDVTCICQKSCKRINNMPRREIKKLFCGQA